MYVKVKVNAGAKKETIKKVRNDTYEMSVKEPAERNLANNRIRHILSEEYNVTIGSVRIISGHHSKSKIFDVTLSSN